VSNRATAYLALLGLALEPVALLAQRGGGYRPPPPPPPVYRPPANTNRPSGGGYGGSSSSTPAPRPRTGTSGGSNSGSTASPRARPSSTTSGSNRTGTGPANDNGLPRASNNNRAVRPTQPVVLRGSSASPRRPAVMGYLAGRDPKTGRALAPGQRGQPLVADRLGKPGARTTSIVYQRNVARVNSIQQRFNLHASGPRPENGGFEAKRLQTLTPGNVINRLGDEHGTYAAPHGTPFPQRALPPGKYEEHTYRVVKSFATLEGVARPAHQQPGGGTQYQLPMSTAELVRRGYLVKVPNSTQARPVAYARPANNSAPQPPAKPPVKKLAAKKNPPAAKK
jgi:hypothetical protein